MGNWRGKPDKKLIDKKKLLKQIIINEGKNRQIEIDERLSNPVGTEEKNRSASGTGYYVFAFLFLVLVAAGRSRFCLVLWDQVIKGQTI